jgi:hypothetical protein
MRKFKYVGTQEQANPYGYPIPVIGKVYNEDDIAGERTVLFYAECRNKSFAREWEEVFESRPHNPINLSFDDKLKLVLTQIKSLLQSKNKKYGNSALEPVRIFSKANETDQILCRIDDKLSRIKNMGSDTQIDEDTVNDLIGYLILLKISKL